MGATHKVGNQESAPTRMKFAENKNAKEIKISAFPVMQGLKNDEKTNADEIRDRKLSESGRSEWMNQWSRQFAHKLLSNRILGSQKNKRVKVNTKFAY